MKTITVDTFEGDFSSAASGTMSLVVGKSVAAYLKQHQLGNGTVQSILGMIAGKTTSAVLGQGNINDER